MFKTGPTQLNLGPIKKNVGIIKNGIALLPVNLLFCKDGDPNFSSGAFCSIDHSSCQGTFAQMKMKLFSYQGVFARVKMKLFSC